MTDQKLFDQINLRCQQAKQNNKPFGGLIVLMSGDPGQLPPTSGLPLWHKGGKNPLIRTIYDQFKIVIKLEGSNRLENDEHKPFLEQLFNNLRNGEVTDQQWETFYFIDH
jgi:hypothetical protein